VRAAFISSNTVRAVASGSIAPILRDGDGSFFCAAAFKQNKQAISKADSPVPVNLFFINPHLADIFLRQTIGMSPREIAGQRAEGDIRPAVVKMPLRFFAATSDLLIKNIRSI
jgi:hypothetical protein